MAKLILLLILLTCKVIHSEQKQEINNIFNVINQNLKKLQTIVVESIDENQEDNEIPNKVPDVQKSSRFKQLQECHCVSFHLCAKGNIIKNGANIIRPRRQANPCKILGEVCCYDNDSDLSSMEDTDEPKIIYDDEEFKDFQTNQCGSRPLISNQPFFDNGSSIFGEFPWMAIVIGKADHTYKGVGSLIHPQVILTTASYLNKSLDYVVRVGEWNTLTRDEPYMDQDRDVAKIVLHPQFNKLTLYYDAALLILKRPVTLAENVNTVCLSQREENLNEECLSSGFGPFEEGGNYNRIMKKVEYRPMRRSECQTELRQMHVGSRFQLHSSFICAVHNGNKNMCYGDGGAPLVCPIPGQNRYKQVGILSWGAECNWKGPSVFAKISKIRPWIDIIFKKLQFDTSTYM